VLFLRRLLRLTNAVPQGQRDQTEIPLSHPPTVPIAALLWFLFAAPAATCPILLGMRKHLPHLAAQGVPGERSLIQRIRGLAGRKSFAALTLGIGDDCALLSPKSGEQIAVTTDLSIAGRHFRLDWHPPEVVGHRTLVRGLSDLAAMGARPLAAFLSLGLPRELTEQKGRQKTWIDRLFEGFLASADANQTPLAGGDLAESPIAVADIVLIGAVPRGRALLRSGARAGDLLYVTGALGGAAAGLKQLGMLAAGSSGKMAGPPIVPKRMRESLAAHFYPQPRLAQGLWLQRRGLATAAIDLSDGLSTDLTHLCEESGLAAEIDASSIPIHRDASLEQALHGGEDYELLFAAPAKARIPKQIAAVDVHQIGCLTRRRAASAQVMLLDEHGSEALESKGWEHFQ
jgi:thiamine-monophosphate kinase